MIDALLSYLAPHSCCGCGEVGSELCEGCKHNINEEGFSSCIGCLRPTHGDNLCASCGDYPVAAFWCVGWRQAELKSLLDHYKFEAARSASTPLIDLLDNVLPLLPGDTVVSIVPTLPAHIRERGFDHTALIGRGLAARRGLEFQPLLLRTASGTQHFKTKKERLIAAQSSFALLTNDVPGRVLLIDDILTTGATFRANLSLLKDAGAKTIYGAIIARQPLDEDADL